jgi:hypothetical protein
MKIEYVRMRGTKRVKNTHEFVLIDGDFNLGCLSFVSSGVLFSTAFFPPQFIAYSPLVSLASALLFLLIGSVFFYRVGRHPGYSYVDQLAQHSPPVLNR